MEVENKLDNSLLGYNLNVKNADDEAELRLGIVTDAPDNNEKLGNPKEEYSESFNSISEETDKKGENEIKSPFLQVSPINFIPDKNLELILSEKILNLEDTQKKSEVNLPITKKKPIKRYIFSIKTEELLETLNYRRKEIEFIISSTSNLNEIIVKILEKCKINFGPQDLKCFPDEFNLTDEEYIFNYQENHTLDINFERIFNACQIWHTACLFPNPLRTKLKSTLWEFISLKKIAETEQDLQFLQEMIKKIMIQLKKILDTPKPSIDVKENPIKPNDILTEVYNFYIKQQKIAAKTLTFDTMDLQFKTLTLPKFLFFCKDFKLLKPGKNPKKVAKQLQALQEIFLKNADFSKQMTKTQFLACLSDLSAFFLTGEYDSQHSTQYSILAPSEKLQKFLEILGLTGKKDIKSKLIGCQTVKLKNPNLSETGIIRKKIEKKNRNEKELKKKGKKSLSLSVNTEKIEEPAKDTGKKITMDYLMKSKNLIDLSEFIQEGSSDEELFKKLEKNKKINLSHSISGKILARGQELSMMQQKSDNKKAESILNSKFINRVFKYSKK